MLNFTNFGIRVSCLRVLKGLIVGLHLLFVGMLRMPSCKVPGHGPLTDNMVAMGYFTMPGNSLQLGET